MDLITAITQPSVLNGTASIEYYTRLWLRAFPQAQSKGKKYWKQRLADLQSWDTCNGKENERQGKISALQILINE
jgi:hypothetical protein